MGRLSSSWRSRVKREVKLEVAERRMEGREVGTVSLWGPVAEELAELELLVLVAGSWSDGIVLVDAVWYFSEVGKRIVQSSVLATASSSELDLSHLRMLRRGQNVATRRDGWRRA